MTALSYETSSPRADTTRTDYQPGVCNIGPAEIARRRRAGHVGLVVSVLVLGLLVIAGAPPLVRLIIALPVAAAPSGYLQAWLKFCAGFGSRGIFNFGPVGATEEVADPDARRLDQARSRRISMVSVAIGAVVAAVAVILPL
jgi:hypothetical protein